MADAVDAPGNSRASISQSIWFSVVLAIPVAQVASLLALGRVSICTCGSVKLWHGVVYSSENSQHIFDWYSFTHVLHGFWLYLFAWLLLPRVPTAARFALAVFLEGAWEVLENTNFVIDRYRADTVSLDYHGDSVINSVADTVTMIFGFSLARILPIWSVVTLGLVIEGALGYLIRDNLLLNVLMLIYPFDAIKAWQEAVPLP